MSSLMTLAFLPAAVRFGGSTRAPPVQRTLCVMMLAKWQKLDTLADKLGSADTLGAEAVGLDGTIPVIFQQGNTTLTTMARPGQPLKQVAMQANQFIRYKCGKGECGTCEVKIDGQWVRTCSASVPALGPGQQYVINVKPSMIKTKKSSRFFSFRWV